jgi:polyphosphate kinase 2 (PPK2 family)
MSFTGVCAVLSGANVETAWKISPRNWQQRQFWDAYTAAYDATITAG